ncbi:MAG: polysaccharide biosynthesis C-terminal domain-containing protein [Acidobacteria bacterium]|nr:polysaccharide biosynthesis C-terminal domain-containing protein [Acidobacteriota bacterium]
MTSPPNVAAARDPVKRSVPHTVLVQVLGFPLALAHAVLVARTFGPVGRGTYDLGTTTAALGVSLLGLSLPAGVTYIVARDDVAPRRIIRAVLPSVLAVTVLFTVSAVTVAHFTTTFPSWVALRPLVPLVVLSFLAMLLGGILRGTLVGQRRIVLANYLELSARAASLVMLVVVCGAVALSGRGSVVTAYAASTAAAWLCAFLLARASFRSGGADVPVRGRELARFLLPVHLANLVQFLNYRLDVFILASLAGPASIGLYGAAVGAAQLPWLVAGSIASVVFPETAATAGRPGEAGRARSTARLARVTLWASGIVAIILALAGPSLIRLLYGRAFEPSAAALLLLLPGTALLSAAMVLSSHVVGAGHPRVNLAIGCVSLVVTVTLDLWLIPKIGIRGAAIASTCSYTVCAILMAVAFHRMTGIGLGELILLRPGDLKVLVGALRAVLPR